MKTHHICRSGDGMTSAEFTALSKGLRGLIGPVRASINSGSLCPRPTEDGAAELCEIETSRGTFTVLLAPGCSTWTSDCGALPPLRFKLE